VLSSALWKNKICAFLTSPAVISLVLSITEKLMTFRWVPHGHSKSQTASTASKEDDNIEIG
jgi:hypothetical protein